MSRNVSIRYAIDWTTIFFYVVLILMGWISIYGASYDFDQASIFDFSQRAGKQFIWILTAFAIGGALLLIDSKLYNIFAWFIYVGAVVLLFATIFLAHDI